MHKTLEKYIHTYIIISTWHVPIVYRRKKIMLTLHHSGTPKVKVQNCNFAGLATFYIRKVAILKVVQFNICIMYA